VNLAYISSCIHPEVRQTPDQRSNYYEILYYGLIKQSSRILHCIEATYLWCLRPKLQICAACCSDNKMEL